jgi:hypothetical protein
MADRPDIEPLPWKTRDMWMNAMGARSPVVLREPVEDGKPTVVSYHPNDIGGARFCEQFAGKLEGREARPWTERDPRTRSYEAHQQAPVDDWLAAEAKHADAAVAQSDAERCAPQPDGQKLSNPKDSVGIRKAPLSCVPGPVLFELGAAMLEGARKYGRHNYRDAGVLASVYFDAAMRHLWAWWEGEDIDPDSGLSHVAKAMACLAILRDSARTGNWNDDRPPRARDGWVQEVNAQAGALIDRYREVKPAHVEAR